jgi:hypothetical protein
LLHNIINNIGKIIVIFLIKGMGLDKLIELY